MEFFGDIEILFISQRGHVQCNRAAISINEKNLKEKQIKK